MSEQEKAEALASEYGREYAGKQLFVEKTRNTPQRGQIIPSAALGGVLLVESYTPPVNLSSRERERREEMGHVDPPNGFGQYRAIFVQPTARETRILEIQRIIAHAKSMRALGADDARVEDSPEYRDAMEAERAARVELAAMEGK
jgi:hypothetical protein